MLEKEEKQTPLEKEFVSEEMEGDILDITDIEGNIEEKIKKIKKELKKCQEERKEYLDGWQRLRADTLNSKQRQENERSLNRDREIILLVEKLLPLCDSFDLAIKNSKGADSTWIKGTVQIYEQLLSILASYHVTAIEAKESVFDPHMHEAVSEIIVENESEDNLVQEILQQGYALGDRVIRPAKVIVGRHQ